ncbi:DUF4168 domain-containing protein [Marinobacter salicampi]|uniref:DUF4168 domain-containing protein n=1 Tax=Marinobacter salicampi TaxID=435907 RepID=UPI00140D8E65|nr:DUF4168 domain-containing protein [Marinobacter salicampi]
MKTLLASVTVSLAMLASAPAIAQQTQGSQQTQGNQQTQGAQANYDDKELKQFIDAQEDINEIREEYMGKIESTDSQEKAQSLQMEANEEMASAIDDAGLDIPTYNAIATAYNSQPEVRNRIDSMM